MDLKKYLCVDAEHIKLIDYIFVDNSIYSSNYTYPKPNSIAIGGDNSIEIFERNGVPKEYQKMYMVCNTVNMKASMLTNKFKVKEYLTDTSINLAISKENNIFGQMAGEKPTFDLNNCYECEKIDVLNFFIGLRNDMILDNYLKALGEIMHLNIKSYFDSNSDKIKKMIK